jgi:hypothetical protein
MEELKRRLAGILDKFAQQEIGNRLSEFAMISLRNLILMAIDEPKQVRPVDSRRPKAKAKG